MKTRGPPRLLTVVVSEKLWGFPHNAIPKISVRQSSADVQYRRPPDVLYLRN